MPGASTTVTPRDWSPCIEAACEAITLPGRRRCLRHATENEKESFLESLGPGGDVDLRGTVLSEDHWEHVLARFTDDSGETVFGSAHLTHSTFACDLDMTEARVAGHLILDGAIFEGVSILEGITVGGRLRLVEYVAHQGLTLRNARVSEDLLLSGGQVLENGISVENATIGGQLNMEQMTVKGPAGFQGCSVEGSALLAGATFHDRVNFHELKVSQHADLEKAVFKEQATFESASFGGIAWFVDVSFQAPSSFNGASFAAEARFSKARFDKRSSFRTITCERRFWFDHVQARAEVDFSDVSLRSAMLLDGSEFEERLYLSNAQIKDCDEFGVFTVRDLLTLDSTLFESTAHMTLSARGISCVGIKCPEGASFHITSGDIVLDRADFGAPSQLIGSERRSAARLLSVRRVDAEKLSIIDMDLSACRFVGAFNIDQIRIEGSSPFEKCPPRLRLRVGRARLWPWAPNMPRRALAEEHELRASWESGRRRPAGWHPRSCRMPTWAIQHTHRSGPPPTAGQISMVYRALRKAQEDQKNDPGAADFYYGEMEMRRRDESTPLAERIILTLYWLVSGYALRASRAFAAIGVLLVSSSILFHLCGPGALRSTSLFTSLSYALETALALPTVQIPLPVGLRLLRVALKILVPLFFGLAALSVRNRVKR